MKRSILILILIFALLTSTVSAASVTLTSPDFDGGMISGIYLDGGILYATDIQNKVVWRVDGGKAEIFAGGARYVQGEHLRPV